MVYLKQGKYELPDGLLYDTTQYLFVDPVAKTIGLTDVGYYFHGIPDQIHFFVGDQLRIGEPFAELVIGGKKIVLTAPCTGIITAINPDAATFREYDTYTKGFLVKCDSITDSKSTLIGGRDLEEWARTLERKIMPDRFSFKLVLVGDNDSGKSTLRQRFVGDPITENADPPKNLEMDSKTLVISARDLYGPDVPEHPIMIKLALWDIGSTCPPMERSMYYAGADAVLLVFNLNNYNSFKNLTLWREETEELLSPRLPTVVIGNKADLPSQVDTAEMEQFAAGHCCSVLTCSAKTGQGVAEIIEKVITTLIHARDLD
jgi:small GTP-binding protein